MYESYTRQALPDKYYRELLGSALCVFNANNAFVIENILRCDDSEKYNWRELIDLEAGHLKGSVRKVITDKGGLEIEAQFTEGDRQILATKTKEKDGGQQFIITEEYLLEFIKENEKLSDMLHKLRGY